MRADESELRARVKDLQAALDSAADAVDAETRTQVEQTLATARERIDLGVDHTIVALVGGTGSGKSSLFNVISGLKFADVGARRPTTSQVTACAWSSHAERLLEWLEVDRDRWIERESELDGDSQEPLRGLVLLDLPDYDSVADAHRELVDAVLPLVDLLVWVVDPQKYADDALHSGYLRRTFTSQGTMLVVVNKIDTVVEEARPELLADVGRLLVDDGLPDVEVLAVSASTGEGIDALRDRFVDAVARRSVAASHVADEVSVAARLLAETLSPDVPRTSEVEAARAVERLAEVVGLEARAGAGSADPDAGRTELAEHQLEPLRARWIDVLGAAMTPGWRDRLSAAAPPPTELAEDVNRRLGRVVVDPTTPRRVRVLRTLTWLAGVLGVLAVVAALLLWTGIVELDGADGWVAPLAIGAAVLLVLALVLWIALGAARRGARRALRDERLERDRAALRAAVEHGLVEPTRPVLVAHHTARTLALAAIDSSSAARTAPAQDAPADAAEPDADSAGPVEEAAADDDRPTTADAVAQASTD